MANSIYDILKEYYLSDFTQLCSYVFVYTGNDRISMDLVHDAFLQVMERYMDPPDKKRYKRIITKILKNGIMTYFRETKRTIPLDDAFFDNMKIDVGEVDPGREECMKKMVSFFRELENPGRLILYLSLYEGFSMANIARMTGLRQRNVYHWKNKALEELKNRMIEAGCDDV